MGLKSAQECYDEILSIQRDRVTQAEDNVRDTRKFLMNVFAECDLAVLDERIELSEIEEVLSKYGSS